MAFMSTALVLALRDDHFSATGTKQITVGLRVQVPLMQNPKTESSEVPSYSDGKLLLLEGSAPFKHVGNLMVSIIETEKVLC